MHYYFLFTKNNPTAGSGIFSYKGTLSKAQVPDATAAFFSSAFGQRALGWTASWHRLSYLSFSDNLVWCSVDLSHSLQKSRSASLSFSPRTLSFSYLTSVAFSNPDASSLIFFSLSLPDITLSTLTFGFNHNFKTCAESLRSHTKARQGRMTTVLCSQGGLSFFSQSHIRSHWPFPGPHTDFYTGSPCNGQLMQAMMSEISDLFSTSAAPSSNRPCPD